MAAGQTGQWESGHSVRAFGHAGIEVVMDDTVMQRVTYLFGAGASHASVKALSSGYGILMRDLGPELRDALRMRVNEGKYRSNAGLVHLINELVGDDTDYEHVITFLDQSVSAIHREFADVIRETFEDVLRDRLTDITEELQEPPTYLYKTLIDTYAVSGIQERLLGCLTLNYDEFLEQAVSECTGRPPHLGLYLEEGRSREESYVSGPNVEVLKLHGSLGWAEAWPVRKSSEGHTLWVPPGIHKAKDCYPFNLLWGRARELLTCDVLRVVGCALGPNDWDLISLLFATQRGSEDGEPYTIEVIDHPAVAESLRRMCPYLSVRSVLEVEEIGAELIAETGHPGGVRWAELDAANQEEVLKRLKGRNWFLDWLRWFVWKTEEEAGSLETDKGIAARFAEENMP